MGAAPIEELELAQIVSDMDQVIANRHRLCIGIRSSSFVGQESWMQRTCKINAERWKEELQSFSRQATK